ncbi:MAG: CHAT domain-containing protein [Armatimonadetes bacterium]|nr:CHAT domain-containing protein [Armatimonadota bacterium]
MQNVRRYRIWLIAAFWAGQMWASVQPGLAARERPELLQSLTSAPAGKLSTTAAEIYLSQPDDVRLLALDLIFYRWASVESGLEPGITNLDAIIGSLVVAKTDAVVTRAAAILRPGGLTPPTATSDDKEKLLFESRQSFVDGLRYSDTSPTRAIESLSACASTLNELGAELSWALATARLAERQLYAARRYRSAEINYSRAHPVFSVYGLRAQAAKLLDDLGHLKSEVGGYYDAHSLYRDSAREWRAVGRGDLAGKQYINAGTALAAAGKAVLARSMMMDGLSLSRSYAYAKDTPAAFATHTQLLLQVASYCASSGDHSAAQDLLREAEENVAERANDPLLVGLVLKDRAAAWTEMRIEPRARECLAKREKILSPVVQAGADAAAKLVDLSIPPAEQSSLLATAETGAMAALDLGRYQQSVDILKQVDSTYRVLKREDDRVRALRNLAAAYTALGERRDALLSRTHAAQIAKDLGKLALVADILRDIKQNALDSGDTETALEALRESVQIIERSENILALADILESRGSLLASLGQLSDAIRDLDRSASIYSAEVDEPWIAARVLTKLADVRVEAGMTAEAKTSLASGIKKIEEWAAAEGADPSTESGRGEMLLDLYFKLIKLEAAEGRTAEVTDRLQKAVSYQWFSMLRTRLAGLNDEKLTKALQSVEERSPGSQPQPRPGSLRKIAGTWSVVLSQAPQFSRLARTNRNSAKIGPIDASDIYKISSRLPQGLAIVEYAVADSSVYALVATRKSVSCWELPASGDSIHAAVRALRKSLSEMEGKIAAKVPIPAVKDWSDPSLLPILAPLSELGETLFEPLAAELAQVSALAFALPQELAGIPFHAIPRDRKGSLKFVVEQYAVTYIVPGALRGLVETRRMSLSPKTCQVAIFADFSGALPGAARESNIIHAIYPKSNIYTGQTATAARFVTAASSCNIVHIAAHHEADPNPAKFSIMLSGKADGAGNVRLADMLRIANPNLQLAVLSACEIVATSDAEASGIASTAEIFANAGFPTVMGALWKVSDAASVSLMSDFYKNLAKLGKKAEALRLAQVSMIKSKQFAHPFYWGTFALYGDPS